MIWPIDLSQPPEVAALAKNVHGFLPSEKFLLRDLWSLHLYRYSGELIVHGQTLLIRPGHAAVIPPGVENEYRYQGVSAHLYVHFRLNSHEPKEQIAAMQHLGDRFQNVYERLAEVMGASAVQMNARIWDTLWTLAFRLNRLEYRTRSMPPLASNEIIDEGISEPLSVNQLARRAELTPSYLSQLFRQVHGKSLLGYIRSLRLQRAVYLLQNSTLAVKAIAANVGYPDLQHFNKVFRAEFGRSPRRFRDEDR